MKTKFGLLITEKEKQLLIKYEQQMRDNAYAIANINDKMREIHYGASRNAMQGIIEYLAEKKAPPRL